MFLTETAVRLKVDPFALIKPVRGIYEYQSSGPDELDIAEGDRIELAHGGKDYAEGWWEGKCGLGSRGGEGWLN